MIIALDIEGRGPSPSWNGIVSIGMCVATRTGEVMLKKRFSMREIAGQEFDPKCLEEFWQPRRELLEELLRESVDAETATKSFRKALDEFVNPYIVVDCPAYDVTFINYYLDHFRLPLLQFDANGVFRPIHDADSYTRGKMGMGFDQGWVNNDDASAQVGQPPIPHGNHMPDADAEHIALHHIQMVTKNGD